MIGLRSIIPFGPDGFGLAFKIVCFVPALAGKKARGSGGRGRPGRGMAGGGVEWETLAREHFEGAVYCMEQVRLTVVFAYVPVHGTTQSRTFRAASIYINKPTALAGVYV